MLMVYHDQESILTLTLTRGPLDPISCYPGSGLCHPTYHLDLITLCPISSRPTFHHLNQTLTTRRFHRHRMQQLRTHAYVVLEYIVPLLGHLDKLAQ